MSEDIERKLLTLGVQPDRRGSTQMVCLLELLMSEPVSPSLTNAYQETGRRFGVRGVQVERNLHAVIQRLWGTEDEDTLRALVPWRSKQDLPSNREFLCALAAHLRIERGARAFQECAMDDGTEGIIENDN